MTEQEELAQIGAYAAMEGPPDRRHYTTGEAEAWRDGWRAARVRAYEIAAGRSLIDGNKSEQRGYNIARDRIAQAIAAMEPPA